MSSQGTFINLANSRNFLNGDGKFKLRDLPDHRHFDLKSKDFLTRTEEKSSKINFDTKKRIRKKLEEMQKKRKISNSNSKAYRATQELSSRILPSSSREYIQFSSTPAKI